MGGEKLIEHLEPSKEPLQIPESIKSTLEVAKTLTPHFVRLSETLVAGVSIVAKHLANSTSDMIMQKMNSSNPTVTKDPRFSAAAQLGKTTVVAVATVWNSLEDAGLAFLNSVGTAATDVINHKYGSEAGKVAKDGFTVAQDVVKTGTALNSIGAKAIAKKVAKESGKKLVMNYGGASMEYTCSTEVTVGIEEMDGDEITQSQLPPPNSMDLEDTDEEHNQNTT
eukprot:TRINITY_DN18720_c0_g1_i1.p1 TRINITY_DN18720_c0_g1~~TRINITY_DN18720_c0_g1_i1.p1  ORF type:complete len:224 (+),score=57.31 TRINITY_DN18720_c0_g1_i1:2-673(+)